MVRERVDQWLFEGRGIGNEVRFDSATFSNSEFMDITGFEGEFFLPTIKSISKSA